MSKHSELAGNLFLEGYNCAQATFCAFCDVTGLPLEEAARLSSSFGGGMGRMREVCGACSGIFMACGMVLGYDDPKDDEQKKRHYARIQRMAARFRERYGTILCRELLSGQKTDTCPTPTKRDASFYEKRPCLHFVEWAAEILDEELSNTLDG